MSLFNQGECQGCTAKDAEIERLVREIERLHKQLERAVSRAFEAASPGITQRVDPRPAPPPLPPRPRRANLPGYEAPPEPDERKEIVLTEVGS